MFKRRTLFIVGAGASAEVGMPVGTELANTISRKLDIRFFNDFGQKHIGDGDRVLFAEFAGQFPNEARAYQNACWQIRDGVRLSNSIDDFLDVHGTDLLVKQVGKSAIAKSILEAERGSALFYDRTNSYNKMPMARLEGTWLIKFMRMLGRGVRRERLETIFDSVAFIVFNYDRCIEQFLLHGLQYLYAIPEAEACKILGKLTVIHPYGMVGYLQTSTEPAGVPFGGGLRQLDTPCLPLSDRIRTYTEQIKDAKELEEIRGQVSIADSIVFLGFAFHDQNLQILKPINPLKRKNIWGTAYAMSDSDISVIRQELLSFFEDMTRAMMQTVGGPMLDRHRCSDLFDYYTKSLPA